MWPEDATSGKGVSIGLICRGWSSVEGSLGQDQHDPAERAGLCLGWSLLARVPFGHWIMPPAR